MSANNHDVAIANTLIATTLDSMEGYRKASEDSHSDKSAFFSQMADERSRVASDLQAYVRSAGGDARHDSSVAGATHRGFMNLKEALSSNDEKAIVEEVERGEDYIKGKFEAALKEDDLTPAARAEIEKAYTSVRAGHDRVSAMKHSMQ
jgi:uncharacterized protein (TIGR02284 family)